MADQQSEAGGAAPGHTISTILLGVDGSAESKAAAAFAASLAIQLRAEVVAAHAVGLLDVWPEQPDHAPKDSHAHVESLVKGAWTEPLTSAGITPRHVLRDGPPWTVLLEIADDVGADLIVIGARGSGAAAVDVLGSTTTKITERAHQPVVVVPTAT